MATAAKHQQQTATGSVRSSPSISPTSSSLPTSPKTKSPISPIGNHNNTSSILSKSKPSTTSILSTSSPSSISTQSPSSSTRSNIIIKSSPSYIDNDEDIATIAKQISDHAEAIYQTWKARGLAPTEILNCHTDSEDSLFGKASSSPVVQILTHTTDMSKNNLEKLVNSFVSQDKARQETVKKNIITSIGGITSSSNISSSSSSLNSKESTGNRDVILTSGTIKDALKKFEANSNTSGYIKPNFLAKSPAIQKKASNSNNQSIKNNSQSQSMNLENTPKIDSSISLSSSLITHIETPLSSIQLNKNVPDVLIDTMHQNKKLPKTIQKTNNKNEYQTSSATSKQFSSTISTSSITSLVVNSNDNSSSSNNNSNTNNRNISSSSNNSIVPIFSNKPQTPAKPANLIKHTSQWPLKNRLSINISSSMSDDANEEKANAIDTKSGEITNKSGTKDITDSASNNIPSIKSIELVKKSADLLDEVSREEERLINALKTGIVLNHSTDSKLPEVITSTLNDNNNKFCHYSRSSNWVKKSNVSPTSSLQQRTLSDVKIDSISLTSPATDIVARPSQITSTTSSFDSSELQHKQQQDQEQQLRSGLLSKWNNELVNKSASTTFNQSLTKNLLLESASITTNFANMTKTDIPIPAPTPGKVKMRPKIDAAVPHPEAKQNIRPFLTRGSVAERVLMFEKCPDVKAPLRTINRVETAKVLVKPPPRSIEESQPPHTTLQRHIKSSLAKNVYIPKFHFPYGKPLPTIALETTLQCLKSSFDSFPNNQVTKDDFHHILKICGLPFYWRMPLMQCTMSKTSGLVDGSRFIDFWKGMSVYCHDQYSRFVYILSRGQRSRPYILHEDLATLVQDVVDTHPGLAFLKEAAEFHSRYVHTVIARIFYTVNRSWSGKITVPELKRSNLLQVIQLLEDEEDINQIMAFFSYEHFYVIYCKFWELDRDHDLFIDQSDLARHNDHALSTRIIERIFSGCVTRGGKTRICSPNGPKMSYTDFVWFLLSEEDKTHPTAIEYWFRCMDLDGDGVISMYELEYFYEEQQQRMELIGIETLPFEDCLCQMLDMIKPVKPGCITLGDLKRCRMTPIFYDTFFNLEKYLEHEQRDPFATQRDNEDGMSDWDRYAAQEYELLVAEEGGDTQG